MDARSLEIIELLGKISIEQLDPDWIKNVIDSDFTDPPDLPSEFTDFHESTNFVGLFNGIKNVLRQWIDSISINGEPIESNQERRLSFSFLSTSSICSEDLERRDAFSLFWLKITKSLNLNGLLSLLFYYIHRGQRYDADDEVRELGILAAGLYFLLLSIPGSNAFRVFHPLLYLKSLDILRLVTKLNIGLSPKKGVRGSKATHRKSDDLYGDDEDEDAELAVLNPQEANKLIRLINILLNDFLRLAQRFSLKHSPESLEETLSILVDVTRCETHHPLEVFIGRHGPASSTGLAYNAYVALQNMCDQLHGNVSKTIILIMKHLLNNILMTARGSSDLSARALGVIREHSVVFVKYLLVQIKEASYEGVYTLLQHLCLQVPDKAEFREKAGKSVVDILKTFPINWHTRFLKWLYKFSHNEKAGHRLFTLEVISKLLLEDERLVDNENPLPVRTEIAGTSNDPHLFRRSPSVENHSGEAASLREREEGNGDPDNNPSPSVMSSLRSIPTDHSEVASHDCNILSHKFLLSVIFSRCRDSAATVRSKALLLLAVCFTSSNQTIILALREIFYKKARPDVFNTPHIEGNINCDSPQQECDDNANQIELPNANRILFLLERRALDTKVTVRKSALHVLENIMKLDKEMLALKYIEVFVEHCRDPALLIRKQTISSFTSILETYPDDERVIKMWVSGIMPRILDPEMKVQERVIEVIDSLLFSRILPYQAGMDSPIEILPWKILSAITDLSYHKFFTKVLMMWSRSELRRPRLVPTVQTHVGHEFDEQAWMLLAHLSQYMPFRDLTFALDYFELYANDPSQVGSYTLQQVLKVLCHEVSHIPGEKAEQLREKLMHNIRNFSLSVELIPSIIDTITIISYKLDGQDEAGQKAIEDWAMPILKKSDDLLKKMLFPKKPCPLLSEEEEELFRHIFTIGELWMLCPKIENKRLFLLMQSIIFHETHIATSSPPRIPSTQTQSSQAPSVTFTPTSRLKSVAVVTLGKMCLQHENQAKRIVPALAKLLETTALPELRNNILFVLSDMCVRYATLVDPLMPQVTACLMDPDVKVRRTTLTLLINLLQEDYLKLKGSFFYRILQCLCDDHEDIRNTVVFFMTECLLRRFPKLFLQHFIECIFHYNCYEEHESYNKFVQSKKEKDLFSLSGAEFREKRWFLYKFMLEHMSDEQLFSTTHRLCQDILGGIVDGRIKLTPSSLPMIEDTFMVLSSEEIKMASLKTCPEDDADQPTDQAEQAAMAGQVIKKTLISRIVKKEVIENIVPILIALKQKLEDQKSPLMKQLLLYFKEIMKDYKNEIKEILAGDKQLAKEIEFDLRKLEQAQQNEEEERRVQREQTRAENEGEEALDLQQQSERPPAPSLGNSPKLRNMATISEEAASINVSHQDDGKNSVAAAKSRESQGLPDESNNTKEAPIVQENIQSNSPVESSNTSINTSNHSPAQSNHPSPSFARRKSDGTELLKRALYNRQKLHEKKDHSPHIDVQTSEEPELPQTDKQVEPEPPELEQQPQPQPDTSKLNLTKECSIVLKRVKATPPMPHPVEAPSPATEPQPPTAPPSEVHHEAPCGFKPLLSIPEDYTREPSPPPPTQNTREKLMRAISTPRGHAVIDNITFINRSQEISCIGADATNASPPKDVTEKSGSTLLLHFRSPEAFAKDDQFSRLRKSSKRSLCKEFNAPPTEEEAGGGKGKGKKPPDPQRPPSGGFLESFTSRHNEDGGIDDDGSDLRAEPLPQADLTSGGSTPVGAKRKGKRSRDAAALSPQVAKGSSAGLVTPSGKKVTPKRSKRRGKR